ncbi:MAG TPA: zf-TFIIB domain-containing protein [bacterium]|jgi:Zn-finger nucleic acid-binding protein
MAMDDISRSGYSKEEEYFYKRNQALIERKRKELDAERSAAEAAAAKGPHWMHCPKCGGAMSEVDLAHIKVDKCEGCQGVFFDHGELEILLESQEPQGFLTGLKRLFG